MASAFSPSLIFHYLVVMHSIVSFIHSQPIGFTLRLIPRFSPESPFYPGNLTFEEKVERSIELSMNRARYMSYLSNSNSSMSTDNLRLWVHPDNYYYVTKVQLGTPASTQTLLVDTGSDLLWTQCPPCINCYSQSIPMFEPDRSTSYSKVPCDDPVCARHKCIDGECRYLRVYASDAETRGLVSRETFTFESDQGPTAVPGFVFGCGNDNKGFTFDQHAISGIMGLNLGRDSLIAQLFDRIRGQFSYCLVYSPGEVTAQSPLRFGEDTVLPPRRDINTIKIVTPRTFKAFYVDLIDVSVGDKRIGFAPGTFNLDFNSGEGGCLFDTGASAMFFPREPYDAVMKEFDEHFQSFNLERVYGVSRSLEYCYRYHPKFRAYASMTLHFRTADYVVAPTYQYFHFEQRGFFCVAVILFPADGRKTVIGAWQQQDMRLLYDLKKGLIKFMPENCAADQ